METKIVKHVLQENENWAAEIRRRMRARGRIMLNFMSSPGSGKTRLLESLIPELGRRGRMVGVIEGDITTTRDAERIQPLGVPVAQVETEFFGGDCHLAANVVLGALSTLENETLDTIIIENVGNLVCPAEFDTGADVNIALLSVTEGEDKPLKYPLMFRNSHWALVGKIDMASAAEADVALIKRNMLAVNPALRVLEVSGKTGQGVRELADWICAQASKLA